MPSEMTVRIGDAEREQVVATLGTHLSLGRLTMSEFESRLDVVYAATTRAQLDTVLTDLPGTAPPPPETPRRHATRPPSWQIWIPWALTGAICLLVWVATSLAQGRPLGFWPIWVIGPWGLVLLSRTWAGGGGCGGNRPGFTPR